MFGCRHGLERVVVTRLLGEPLARDDKTGQAQRRQRDGASAACRPECRRRTRQTDASRAKLRLRCFLADLRTVHHHLRDYVWLGRDRRVQTGHDLRYSLRSRLGVNQLLPLGAGHNVQAVAYNFSFFHDWISLQAICIKTLAKTMGLLTVTPTQNKDLRSLQAKAELRTRPAQKLHKPSPANTHRQTSKLTSTHISHVVSVIELRLLFVANISVNVVRVRQSEQESRPVTLFVLQNLTSPN